MPKQTGRRRRRARGPVWVERVHASRRLRKWLRLRSLRKKWEQETVKRLLGVSAALPMLPEALAGEAEAIVRRCEPLAVGLERFRRFSGTSLPLVLVRDPERAEGPLAVLGAGLPPACWIELPPRIDGMLDRIEPLALRAEEPPIEELQGHWRTPIRLGCETLAEVAALVTRTMPWLDDMPWGSAFVEDPFEEPIEEIGLLPLALARRQLRAQHPDRVPSLTFWAPWSGSQVRFERYPDGAWALDVRYVPAGGAPDVHERVARYLPVDVPEELPPDVLATLLAVRPVREEDVAERPDDARCLLLARAALAPVRRPMEPSTQRMLEEAARELGDDEAAFEELAQIAVRHGFWALALRWAAERRGTPLGERLQACLGEGVRAMVDPARLEAAEANQAGGEEPK